MGNPTEVDIVDTQALQLHEKVQKLIEQYTLDKKRLSELETALADKTKAYDELKALHDKQLTDNQHNAENNSKLLAEIEALKKKNQELENVVFSIEGFANDLNAQIDGLIPIVDKL